MTTSNKQQMTESELQAQLLIKAQDEQIYNAQQSILQLAINKVSRQYGYKQMYFIKASKALPELKGKVELFVEFSTRPDSNGNFYAIPQNETRPVLMHVSDKRFDDAFILTSVTFYAFAKARIANNRKTVESVERVNIKRSYVTSVTEDSLILSQYVNTEKSPDTWKLLELPESTQKAGISVKLLESLIAGKFEQFMRDWNLAVENQPKYTDLRKALLKTGEPLNPLAFSQFPESTRQAIREKHAKDNGYVFLPVESTGVNGTALNDAGQLSVNPQELPPTTK